MQQETQFHLIAGEATSRLALKPHDRTRTAPKERRAKVLSHVEQEPSHTKRGPGRKHLQGKPGNRIAKVRPIRAYRALLAAWASKVVAKHELRDAHGAYTLVGAAYAMERVEPDTNREHVFQSWTHGDDFGYSARRKWLAGISAQRGY